MDFYSCRLDLPLASQRKNTPGASSRSVSSRVFHCSSVCDRCLCHERGSLCHCGHCRGWRGCRCFRGSNGLHATASPVCSDHSADGSNRRLHKGVVASVPIPIGNDGRSGPSIHRPRRSLDRGIPSALRSGSAAGRSLYISKSALKQGPQAPWHMLHPVTKSISLCISFFATQTT